MILRSILVLGFAIALNFATVDTASAELKKGELPEEEAEFVVPDPDELCTQFKPARVQVEQFRGSLLENHEKSAFEIAREKSQLYNQKMPLRQGSMGHTAFKDWIDVEIDTHPGLGCYVIQFIKVKLEVDNKIEIANDFGKETCLYAEFYGLEGELMRQDEEIINEGVMALKAFLKETFAHYNAYKVQPGVNIDYLKREKEEAIEHVIKNKLRSIQETIFQERIESDSPDFYDEIVADCQGLH